MSVGGDVRDDALHRLPASVNAHLQTVAGTLGREAAALGAAGAAMLAP